jgi:hypothetical protein
MRKRSSSATSAARRVGTSADGTTDTRARGSGSTSATRAPPSTPARSRAPRMVCRNRAASRMFGWVSESWSVSGGSSRCAAATSTGRPWSWRMRTTPTEPWRTSTATSGRSGSRNRRRRVDPAREAAALTGPPRT